MQFTKTRERHTPTIDIPLDDALRQVSWADSIVQNISDKLDTANIKFEFVGSFKGKGLFIVVNNKRVPVSSKTLADCLRVVFKEIESITGHKTDYSDLPLEAFDVLMDDLKRFLKGRIERFRFYAVMIDTSKCYVSINVVPEGGKYPGYILIECEDINVKGALKLALTGLRKHFIRRTGKRRK